MDLSRRVNRRRYLAGTLAGVTASVAGCSGDGGDQSGDGEADSDDADSDGQQSGSAEYELSDLDPGDAEVNPAEAVIVAATVSNVGDAEGAVDVTVSVGEEPLESRTLTLAAGAEEVVEATIDTTDLSAGDHQYEVAAGEETLGGTLTVLGPASFTLSEVTPSEPTAPRGSDVAVTAVIRNDGDVQATEDLTVVIDGETVATEPVSPGPGDTWEHTHTFGTGGLDIGDHEFAFRTPDDELVGTLTITEPSPDPVVVDGVIPDPAVLDVDHVDEGTFSVTLRNEGDDGLVGYGIIFAGDDTLQPWGRHMTDWDTTALENGATVTEEIRATPSTIDEYYAFRTWPHEVAVTIQNEGGSGSVEVVVLNDGEEFTMRTVALELDAEKTVTMETNFGTADVEPGAVEIAVRIRESE